MDKMTIENIMKGVDDQDTMLTIKQDLVESLSRKPMVLPSLFFWDTKGIQLYDDLSNHPGYYLPVKEKEILNSYSAEIAQTLPQDFVLIELGCGVLEKTSLILSALEKKQKKVTYYGLDVSRHTLSTSLERLHERFQSSQYIQVKGLLGKYEDCIEWLESSSQISSATPVGFLWIGNTFANAPPADVASLIKQFQDSCSKKEVSSFWVVSADACSDVEEIHHAYSVDDGPLREWMLNGLRNARTVLEHEGLDDRIWSLTADFIRSQRMLHLCFRSKTSKTMLLGETEVEIPINQELTCVLTGKWSEDDVDFVARGANLQVTHSWGDTLDQYYFYLLQAGI